MIITFVIIIITVIIIIIILIWFSFAYYICNISYANLSLCINLVDWRWPYVSYSKMKT